MITLTVFVVRDCWSCAESRRLVAEMAPRFPRIAMEVVELAAGPFPQNVFAVPTYLLDGRVISLGNPHPRELHQMLQQALNTV